MLCWFSSQSHIRLCIWLNCIVSADPSSWQILSNRMKAKRWLKRRSSGWGKRRNSRRRARRKRMTRLHRTARKKRSLSVRLLQLSQHKPQHRKVHIMWTAAVVVAVGCVEMCHLIVSITVNNLLCAPQLLRLCLLRFPCLLQKLLPRQTNQLRVKQSWKLRGELGKRLRGPPNRARRERWGSRPPRANLKHHLVSCSQVL